MKVLLMAMVFKKGLMIIKMNIERRIMSNNVNITD
jgi:hypothetical protein